MGKGWNRRHGLTTVQEAMARQIRSELKDEDNKKIHYDELKFIFKQYKKTKFAEMNLEKFGMYVKECYPSLYSAFKRLDIDLLEAAQNE